MSMSQQNSELDLLLKPGKGRPLQPDQHDITLETQPRPSNRPEELSASQKLGTWALRWIFGSSAIICFAFGSISFIWFADHKNSVWRFIILRSWTSRIVAICSLLIRVAVTVQDGIGAAMLVALAIESYEVQLKDAAATCFLRSGKARMLSSVMPIVNGRDRAKGLWGYRHVILVVALNCFSSSLQLASTSLLSDLGSGELPGNSSNVTLSYDILYSSGHFQSAGPSGWGTFSQVNYSMVPRASIWFQTLNSFATFAEYSETLVQSPDLDDTGVLIRAFLPYTDVSLRESLLSYTGKATVLDSRVICQRPNADGIQVINSADSLVFDVIGVAAGMKQHPKLLIPDSPPNFRCKAQYAQSQYSICQLQESQMSYNNVTNIRAFVPRDHPVPYDSVGGLISEFSNMTVDTIKYYSSPFKLAQTWGSAYMILKTEFDPRYTTGSLGLGNYSSSSDESFRTVENGTSLDLILNNRTANISLTLCYTAWDTSDLPVRLQAASSRTEPKVQFNSNANNYVFKSVLDQLNYLSGSSLDSRNVPRLEKLASWRPEPQDARPMQVKSYANVLADMNGAFTSTFQSPHALELAPPSTGIIAEAPQLAGNWTMLLADAPAYITYNSWMSQYGYVGNVGLADLSLTTLFNEAFDTTGSMAFAMSCLVTTLSSMAYYDQFPQSQKTANVTQVFSAKFLFPQSKSGFVAIATALVGHMVIMYTTSMLFVRKTKFTMLGNNWQAVAQLLGNETREVLQESSVLTDRDVAKNMEDKGIKITRVGIAFREFEGKVSVGRVS